MQRDDPLPETSPRKQTRSTAVVGCLALLLVLSLGAFTLVGVGPAQIAAISTGAAVVLSAVSKAATSQAERDTSPPR